MSIIDVVKYKLSRGQVIFRKPTIEQLIAKCDNVIIESEHEGRMAKQYHDMCGEIAQERDALRAENERYRKALEYYADDESWVKSDLAGKYNDEWAMYEDGWKEAREALKGK